MNLTEEQLELLEAIVDVYNSGCRSEFMVIRHSSASGLVYLLCPDHQVLTAADDTDFQRLAREDVLDLRRGSDGHLRGKPTARGVRFVEELRLQHTVAEEGSAPRGAPGQNPQPESGLQPAEEVIAEERGRVRSNWLDKQLALKEGWSSDLDIQHHGGPSYNTIRSYRSGAESTRGLYVRGKLAKAFGCTIDDVPE